MSSQKIYFYVISTKKSLRFALPCTLYLGRDETCEIYVSDTKVSRKHAQIIGSKTGVELKDLSSTNGTFLNNKKIKKATLKEADTIRIGTSIIEFYSKIPSFFNETKEESKKTEEAKTSHAPETVVDSITGNIDGKSLIGLYHFLHKTKDTGIIKLQSKDSMKGFITFYKGNIIFVKYGSVYTEKALARIQLLTEGSFLYTPGSITRYPLEITEDLESLLAKIDTEIKEYTKLSKVFDKIKRFKLNRNMTQPLQKLSNDALVILQLVIVNGTVDYILDNSPLRDTETLRALAFLYVSSFIVSA